MKIRFYEKGIKSGLTNRTELRQSIKVLFINESIDLESTDIIFCTDNFLRDLNRKFLQHDYFTDTLTFNLDDNGEIYISIDRIRENSKHYKITYEEELLRVIIHGCLHLCGYSDKPVRFLNKMIKKQEQYLNEWMFHVKRKNLKV